MLLTTVIVMNNIVQNINCKCKISGEHNKVYKLNSIKKILTFWSTTVASKLPSLENNACHNGILVWTKNII